MIAADQIAAIAEQVEQRGLSEQCLGELRAAYPGIHFTYCMDDDVGTHHRPYLEREAFNLYLVDGREHCLRMTTELVGATGLVLAEVIRDGG